MHRRKEVFLSRLFLSIVIPIFNGEKYIERCLNSLVKQDDNMFELILVFNACNDKSEVIADKYIDKFKHITFIKTDIKGIVHARALGIENSNADYIAFLDIDDTVTQNYISKIHNIITLYQNVDCVMFDFYEKYESNNKLIVRPLSNIRDGYYNKKQIQNKIAVNLFFNKNNTKKFFWYDLPWARIFKRKILINHHCTDNNIIMWEDFAYVREATMNCNSLIYYKEPLSLYMHYNPDCLTSKHWGEWYKACEYCLNRFEQKEIKNEICTFFLSYIRDDIAYNIRYKLNSDEWKHQLSVYKNTSMFRKVKLKNIITFKLKIFYILIRLHLYFVIELLGNFLTKIYDISHR